MSKRLGTGLSASAAQRPAPAGEWNPWAHEGYLRTLLGAAPDLGVRSLFVIVLNDHPAATQKPIRRWLGEVQATPLTREQLASE